jgi:2',3'-cyclic-nucleotide 2'-phosphodiesterase (5'-nucleotidase family)
MSVFFSFVIFSSLLFSFVFFPVLILSSHFFTSLLLFTAAVGSFPHISEGWEIKYDLSCPPLHRILSVSYQQIPLDGNGDLDTPYLVAISDFYVGKGGDGVDAFTTQEVVADHKELISNCVVEYLGSCVDSLDGAPPGRFVSVCRN